MAEVATNNTNLSSTTIIVMVIKVVRCIINDGTSKATKINFRIRAMAPNNPTTRVATSKIVAEAMDRETGVKETIA